ncbi:MAG TPA: serine hydrolase domain-containing protein [Saprospiraceae bacterium]|nr:serine hydrolase domain-containing protein [Saprospiraceae bacterium]
MDGRKLFLFIAIMLAIQCKQEREPVVSGSAIQRQVAGDFQPAAFTQTDRLQRVLDLTPRIDSLFEAYAEAQHLPSYVYGIVMDGSLIHQQGWGVLNLETKAKPDGKTLYRVASMTKSLTAMAILKLQEMGKLSVQDPAEKYIPELKSLPYPTREARPITIHQLLTMTAGFPEDNPWADRQLQDSDEELLAFVRKGVAFSTPPGTGFEYSNLGFALLGQVIIRASGMPYQQYMNEFILGPIGMTHSIWDYETAGDTPLALGYRWEEEQWKAEPILKDGAYACMGGFISTLEDWARYEAYLLSAWPSGSEGLPGPVSAASVRAMQQPYALRGIGQNADDPEGPCGQAAFYGYGLGWNQNCHGLTYIAHSGGLPGYGSVHVFIPELGIGIIAFANRTYAGMGTPTNNALDLIIAKAGLDRRNIHPSSVLESMRAALTELLPSWPDSPRDSLFAENFFLDQSKALRKIDINKVFDQIGAVDSTGPMIPSNQLRGRFTIYGHSGKARVFFTCSPEKQPKIQYLSVRTE